MDEASLLDAWHGLYRDRMGASGRIDRDTFRAVFGRELACSPGAFEATLTETAKTLSRRGVALADALSAVALLAELAGPDTAAELRRVRTYTAVWLSGERPSRCRLPFDVGHGRLDDDHGMVGTSAPMQRLRELVAKAARGPRTVLVTGEPGTGKELVARAIHNASGARGPFVSVSCAETPRELMEAELFGQARGVLSSGVTPGLFRRAEGGTLFLDEIAEMGADVQMRLLRAIEQRAIRPVGGTTEERVDVRVVVSTSRDPRRAMAVGHLREDLYDRLLGFVIAVPPLRERRDDVPLLVEHFMGSFCSRRSGCLYGFAPQAIDALVSCDWPGNVAELRGVVEQAITTGSGGLVQLDDLPPAYRRVRGKAMSERAGAPLPTLAQAEEELIRLALVAHRGNKLRAAKALGISRHKLYDKLKSMGEPADEAVG